MSAVASYPHTADRGDQHGGAFLLTLFGASALAAALGGVAALLL